MDLKVVPYERDELLLARCRKSGRPEIEVYRPDSTELVMGRGSRVELELEASICQEDELRVSRRLGGGCAVILDAGNLVLSVALPLPGVGGVRAVFNDLTKWVIEGLGRAGLSDVEKAGSSDLALLGKKVGGSCVYRAKGFFLYSTTLLFRPPIDAAERYLGHPPREPDYRAARRHSDFMGSLDSEGDLETWLQRLREVFTPDTLPESANQ
jgi:lipoate---protein ligase